MDIRNLETFVMVNELKSFTQAAQKLGYTQSTVSFQVKQLEEELGLILFERINHTVKLTNAGEKLLPIAQKMLHLSAEASHIAGSVAPEGVVRMALPESLSNWQLRHHFRDFHLKYPGIRLKVISGSTDEMFRLLGQNQVDLVYTLDRHIFNHKYEVAFESPVPISFVAGKDHPLSKKGKISREDMLCCRMILTEKNMSYRNALDEYLASHGVTAHPMLEVGDTNLICELLAQNVGVSYLPDFVTEEYVEKGQLVRLNAPDLKPDIWRQILFDRHKWISPELECVIEYFKN